MIRLRSSHIFVVLSVILLAALVSIPAWSEGEQEAQGTQGQEQQEASFRLNWKITGVHSPYYLGQSRGYYEEEGVDLQLDEGNGSVSAAQLVANKSNTFGLANIAAVIPLVDSGLPIKVVGVVSPRALTAVIAREDSGIRALEDLEGKTIAATAGSSLVQLWPALVERNNLNEDEIELVYVDANAKIPMVLENTADALLGAANSQNFVLQSEGVDTVDMVFADNGVNVMSLGIWVHEDTIEDKPELIRAFLRATKRSIEAYLEDAGAAGEMVVEAKPELNAEVVKRQASTYSQTMDSPNCPDADVLYNCPADWSQTLSILKEYRGMETDLGPEDFYTNEFQPE